MSSHDSNGLPEGPQLLSVEAMQVHFAGVRAVDGVDLSVTRGEILGLMGPNGAGKTTLLNAVSGFLRPTAGRVLLDHIDVTGWSPERLVRTGLVRTFQGTSVFRQLTVFENIELGVLAVSGSRAAARRRVAHLMELLHVSHVADRLGGEISQGDERKVGIARSVGVAPHFLLLDEPAAGLNDAEGSDLVDVIRGVRDELSCAIVLVEHDMRVILGASDRLHVLVSGRSLADGEPSVVMTDQSVIDAYLGAEMVIDAHA